MREEADEGNLVRSFGALDAERNYYQNAGSDRRQRRGGAEQIRTPLREEVFTDIQKHYVWQRIRIYGLRRNWKIHLRKRPEAHEGLLLPPVQRIRARHEWEHKQNDTAVLAERNRLPESNRRIYSARRNVDQQLPARDFRLWNVRIALWKIRRRSRLKPSEKIF